MSFQGRGRGRSSGFVPGRGRGRSGRFSQINKDNVKTKEYEMKFNPYNGSKINVPYDTVKDHILQTIQKTFKNSEDIVESLREGELIDLKKEVPTIELIDEKDVTKRRQLEKAAELRYSVEYGLFSERIVLLKNNLTRAYALIFRDHCTKMMQSRIEQHHNFETEIRDDPIMLLDVIRGLLYDTERGKYPYSQITDSFKNFLLTRQMENESLLEYSKRFKQNRDMLKQQVGTNILDEFIESTPR
jgi:hypothetical protein